MKRTHKKVRTGCTLCRQRRVKCDELRPQCSSCQRLAQKRPQILHCTYAVEQEPRNSFQIAPKGNVPLPSNVSTAVSGLSFENPLSLSSNLVCYNSSLGSEQQLWQHLHNERAKMERVLQSGLLVGIQQFFRYWPMVVKFPYVADCLKSISASHLRSLTKSSAMACIENEFRVRAIHGMVAELRHVQREDKQEVAKETLECLDVSSKLLAWYSATPNEYAGFLKGVYTLDSVYNEMSRVQGPQQNHARSTVSSHHLDATSDALRSFNKCNLDTELKLATRELLDLVHNLSRSLAKTRPDSYDAQLKIVYPIRSWLRLVPCAPNRLQAGDFMMHLFLANYEMLMLSISLSLPHISLPLAIEGRKAGLEQYYMLVKDIIDTRFLRDRNVANLTHVYQACFQWMSALDVLRKGTHSDGCYLRGSLHRISRSEWQGTAYINRNLNDDCTLQP